MAGINFGSFFLSDDLLNPYTSFYNLTINGGEVLQLPSNNRPCLLTHAGELQHFFVLARGSLRIGDRSFTWTGSHNQNDADLTAFGMFDLTILKSSFADLSSNRRTVIESRHVVCTSKQKSLAFKLHNGHSVIETVTNQPIDLTQYAFVLRGKADLLDGILPGQIIDNIEMGTQRFGVEDDVCSASFSLGKSKAELEDNLRQQLVYQKDGLPKPLSDDYLKSWSVVLETKDKMVFFINDARPKIKNQSGITVFELQELLSRRFDYSWACVGDSGQSSKLMLINGANREVYGNMHYQNYRQEPPTWDGENGRPIPVALLAYE